MRQAQTNIFKGSFEQAVTQTEAMLSQSVQMQMLSDVPIGSFLSGGIDSSLVTALMQENSMIPINTFSIGFKDKDYNEYYKSFSKYSSR